MKGDEYEDDYVDLVIPIGQENDWMISVLCEDDMKCEMEEGFILKWQVI